MNRRRGYSQDDPRRQPSRRPSASGGNGPPAPSVFSRIGGAIAGGPVPPRRNRSASPHVRPSRPSTAEDGRGLGVSWGELGGRDRSRSRSRSSGRGGGRSSPGDESAYTVTSGQEGDGGGRI